MTHVLILQGTQTGGVPPGVLSLTMVVNQQSFGGVVLDYVAGRHINLTRVVNAQTFGAVDLELVVVRDLSVTQVINASSFGSDSLALVPFVPVNAETVTLIAAFDQTYPTTTKRQIDTLITELKAAGVWAKLDWYGNAYWATSEHDALLNWVNPAQTLTKVGTATWTAGLGLSGVNPTITSARYKSGWNVGSGPNSGATDFAMFVKITAVAVPQNGMQPMGVWRLSSGGGPVTPDGAFLSLSVLANVGFAGGNLMNGNGNTSFVTGDGLGVWGVSHNGGTQITVKDGVTLETDSVSGSSSYTDAEGISVAGSAGLAKRSFPGTELYWGWGAALSAAEFAAVESSFQEALLPPGVLDSAWLINGGGDYFAINASDDYWKVN